MEASLWSAGKSQGNLLSGSAQLSADLKLMIETRCASGIPMVTGLETGELKEPDRRRPSLILRRKGKETLWELAKRSGSTVAAIEAANPMDTEPDEAQMLLIPVM